MVHVAAVATLAPLNAMLLPFKGAVTTGAPVQPADTVDTPATRNPVGSVSSHPKLVKVAVSLFFTLTVRFTTSPTKLFAFAKLVVKVGEV